MNRQFLRTFAKCGTIPVSRSSASNLSHVLFTASTSQKSCFDSGSTPFGAAPFGTSSSSSSSSAPPLAAFQSATKGALSSVVLSNIPTAIANGFLSEANLCSLLLAKVDLSDG
ncbi:hypothetical protein HDU77_004370 [Chytriomyces hyalinus]|nr:hypothetical protein HDU77_004370 [Chytriomyces hyalinus]